MTLWDRVVARSCSLAFVGSPRAVGRPSFGWARALLCVAVAAAAGCRSEDAPRYPWQWSVVVSSSAPEAVRTTAEHVVRYLGSMGQRATLRAEPSAATRCITDLGQVVFVGDGVTSAHDEGVVHAAPDAGVADARDDPRDPLSRPSQRFRIHEARCGSDAPGVHVSLSGGGLFGRQYAAYEWLHALGVRFFHPEDEFVPQAPLFPRAPMVRDHTPPFQFRSVSLHLTHPLELGDALRLGNAAYTEEVRRYIDWQVKNLATDGLGGFGERGAPLFEYGLRRGFPRSGGLNLHSVQQGGRPILDPDDPRPESQQLADAIEARMDVPESVRPRFFGFTFNPSEFTEIPDVDAVRQMTFIADYMRERYPDTIITTINHGTAGPPTSTYGVRFYDLPKFAPPNLGVRVHSLMFYDLFRPAPVYGNESFRFLYDFMVSEYRTRRLWHFPEAAWWLTFDIAVPLYLPITVEARDRDIQGIRFMLDGKLVGHHTFGTGHEWGYWQNEYCALRMSADLAYRWRDCLRDIASPAGSAAPVLQAAMERVVELQERDIVYGDLLAYLVGTDPETEVAAQVGVVFHPLPPSPAQVASWDLAQVTDFERRIAPALARMVSDYAELGDRLSAVALRVPARGRRFFDEVADGIEVTRLRAQHALQVYGALVTLRASKLRADTTLAAQAQALLTSAKATTTQALAVIARREAGYRYAPLSRAIAGGAAGTDDTNWTVYKYRYLNRTHHGYYYTRVDRLAEEAFAGGSDAALSIEDALVGPGESLRVSVDSGLMDPVVRFGDGAEAAGRDHTHAYGAPGVYEVSLRARRGEAAVEASARVASLRDKARTGFTAKVLAPAGAAIIERVLPGLAYGALDDTALVVGFSAQRDGKVSSERWSRLLLRSGASVDGGAPSRLETAPARLVVPVVNQATGAALTSLVVDGATFTFEPGPGLDGGPPRTQVTLAGELPTQAVVDALVAVGGFDQAGARSFVASTLGFTPDTLPATVPMRVRW